MSPQNHDSMQLPGRGEADILRVAVAQIDIAPRDVSRNLDKHLEVIAEARQGGADLLVFPELSLTGYRLGADSYRLGMTIHAEPLSQLASAAGDMHVVVGFVEEAFAAQFFNTSAVLHEGRVLHVHRKLNLATYGDMDEGKFFAEGRYVETFPLPGPYRATVLICSDMWNPGLVHLAALHGATLLLAPTNSSLDAISGDTSKPGRWDIFLRHYATIYGMPIAFANRIGVEEGFSFWGGSRIFDAFGNVCAHADNDEEALLIAEIDYEDVRRARYELPTVRDSNLSLIQREIQRLTDRIGIPARFRKS